MLCGKAAAILLLGSLCGADDTSTAIADTTKVDAKASSPKSESPEVSSKKTTSTKTNSPKDLSSLNSVNDAKSTKNHLSTPI